MELIDEIKHIHCIDELKEIMDECTKQMIKISNGLVSKKLSKLTITKEDIDRVNRKIKTDIK